MEYLSIKRPIGLVSGQSPGKIINIFDEKDLDPFDHCETYFRSPSSFIIIKHPLREATRQSNGMEKVCASIRIYAAGDIKSATWRGRAGGRQIPR